MDLNSTYLRVQKAEREMKTRNGQPYSRRPQCLNSDGTYHAAKGHSLRYKTYTCKSIVNVKDKENVDLNNIHLRVQKAE